jgi:GGDEF domain-containing protein
LAIETVGRWEADEFVVALSAQFVSDVLSAAELLSRQRRSVCRPSWSRARTCIERSEIPCLPVRAR